MLPHRQSRERGARFVSNCQSCSFLFLYSHQTGKWKSKTQEKKKKKKRLLLKHLTIFYTMSPKSKKSRSTRGDERKKVAFRTKEITTDSTDEVDRRFEVFDPLKEDRSTN